MKKIITLLSIFFILASCQKTTIEEPNNLISEDVMVDILYDLSLLEAIKSQNPTSLETNKINPNDYIYKKYKIDSLQFAKSDQYYATDIRKYKKMYDRVSEKLGQKIERIDGSKKAKTDSIDQIVR